jgi:uncharacterized protein YcbX
VIVDQLWRFPVKSMGGQQVDEVGVTARGLHADRLWAVRDLDNGITASARRVPALLGCSARYLTEPGADAGPGNVPDVVITFPDGSEIVSSDPQVHDRLGEIVGREVRLVALPPPGDTSQHRMSVEHARANFSTTRVREDFGLSEHEALIDSSVFTTKQILTLSRYSTPPNTFVDLAAVHLLSRTSLASLAVDGEPYDVRRFRPNVLVDIAASESEYPESAWVGSDVRIGSATLHIVNPTIRCVVPTRPQPGVDLDRGLTRRLAERTDRFLGVYSDVTRPGVIRVGDVVTVHAAAAPGIARRVAARAEVAAKRQIQRVLEKTVLASGRGTRRAAR